MQAKELSSDGDSPRLQGKVALVSDIGSAHGVAMVRRFVKAGALVAACPAGGEHRTGPAAALTEVPPEVVLLEGDVCAPGVAQRIVDAVADRFGRLDILVNHGAGGRFLGTILDVSREDFDAAITGDVWSVIALSAAAIPLMTRSGGGSIINITTIGRRGLDGRPLRATGGGALSALTVSMALDHGAAGIRVNALVLGPTQAVEPPTDPEELRALMSQFGGRTALGTMHTAEDVAAAALFLASDEARRITGARLTLDAGRSLSF
ncbi:MAG: hypothetical protein QOF51_136 [Chloroflexota bacterium]|jgi:NAD(P)-dependent dehydrogenase (short-subunit alcohol dehydrogenase family)|nr:hypothetical protein [Chloroflexota bacterium]